MHRQQTFSSPVKLFHKPSVKCCAGKDTWADPGTVKLNNRHGLALPHPTNLSYQEPGLHSFSFALNTAMTPIYLWIHFLWKMRWVLNPTSHKWGPDLNLWPRFLLQNTKTYLKYQVHLPLLKPCFLHDCHRYSYWPGHQDGKSQLLSAISALLIHYISSCSPYCKMFLLLIACTIIILIILCEHFLDSKQTSN